MQITLYITRKECGDTVANYGCNKAVVDNTRIKNIIIIITVRFDYQWVVFIGGFQQYTMSFRTTQVKMNFLTMHAFILYFHFSNTITDSSEKPPQMAFTTSTSQ